MAILLGTFATAVAQTTTVVLSANFDSGANGFKYADARPNYETLMTASELDNARYAIRNHTPGAVNTHIKNLAPQTGGWMVSAGERGGGLKIGLTAPYLSVSDSDFGGILRTGAFPQLNGRFTSSFTLSRPADVTLSFKYRTTIRSQYVFSSRSQSAAVFFPVTGRISATVNGAQAGVAQTTFTASQAGCRTNRGLFCSNVNLNTGWRPVTIQLGSLPAGRYQIALKAQISSAGGKDYSAHKLDFASAFDTVRVSAASSPMVSTPDGPIYGESDLVGATAGKFSVTPTGSASYSIPIAVPAGTAGMQPEVSLNYASAGGSGIAGPGWSIGGLSSIDRCPATKRYDGLLDPVDYDGNDRFCLNGERLVAISGAYGANGTQYRTAYEQFTRIISYGRAGNGPARFRVWTRAGEILDFGDTANARIEAVGRSDVRSWALNRLQDRSGNYIVWRYFEDAANGEFGITRIDYTGNDSQGLAPYNSITFSYTDEFAASQARAAFHDGRLYKRRKRLSSIRVKAGTKLFREYRLAYKASTRSPETDYDLPLTSITECLPTLCLKPTRFTWSADGGIGFNKRTLSSAGIPGQAMRNFRVGATGDFNGDGLTDLYLHKADIYGRKAATTQPDYIWISDGDGTFTKTTQTLKLAKNHVLGAAGDFNRDGRTDLYFYPSDQHGRSTSSNNDRIWIARANGHVTATLLEGAKGTHGGLYQYYKPFATGDFNGDGATDIYWIKADNYGRIIGDPNHRLWLSNGKGSFVKSTLGTGAALTGQSLDDYTTIATGDINGDGSDDLLMVAVDEKNGVDYRRGRNPTLRIPPMPFHDAQDGIFADSEVSCDPAITSTFADSLNDLGSELV